MSCGDGTYGTVYEATNNLTKEKVAIKKMKRKFSSWDEAMALREIKALRKLNNKNIIKLKEVLRQPNGELNLVFDYVKCTILDLIRDRYR
jgi:serine/threonine protein kinase